MDILIARHCHGSHNTKSGKIDIRTFTNIPLRTVLYNIDRMEGVQALHEVRKSHFMYELDCLSPIVFSWCEGLLVNMKDQLTKCKTGKLKKNGYRSILVTFFLECVLLFRYYWLEVETPRPRDPRLLRWRELMPRHGGGQQMSFPPVFFVWLRQKLMMVDD